MKKIIKLFKKARAWFRHKKTYLFAIGMSFEIIVTFMIGGTSLVAFMQSPEFTELKMYLGMIFIRAGISKINGKEMA